MYKLRFEGLKWHYLFMIYDSLSQNHTPYLSLTKLILLNCNPRNTTIIEMQTKTTQTTEDRITKYLIKSIIPSPS